MIETLSTTSIILLARSIDDLEHYFDWIIASSAFVITIIIALFVTIQFAALRRIQNQDIEKMNDGLKKVNTEYLRTLDEKIKTEFLKIESNQENNEKRLGESMDKKILLMEADTARLFAISANNSGVHEKSFTWWLRAASKTIALGDDEKAGEFLGFALDELNNDKINKNMVKHDAFENSKIIEEIKLVRKIEGKLIEQKLEEVIGIKNTTLATLG